MIEDLKKLGLTDNEIKVYLSLIKVGETPVGGIINDLGIHRQIVYNALESLEQRNLVNKTIVNKITHFKPADPRALVENIKAQEMIAERLSQSLLESIKKDRHIEEVNIYSGIDKIRAFYKLKYETAPENHVISVMFAIGREYTDSLGTEFLKRMDAIRVRKNLVNRHITGQASKKDLVKTVSKLHNASRQIRYLPQTYASPVTTIIWHDCVAFHIYGANPLLIEIKNEKVRESHLLHFETLWQIAKE